jgi:fructan beta-fructosidase
MKLFLLVVMGLMAGAAWAADRADVLIADFEAKDYGQWKAEGEAFGPGPAQGTLPNQMPVSGYLGKGLVNSYYKGDDTTGKLTSPTFAIERKYINFLIGGGKSAGKSCINLLIDGQTVRTTTGPNDRPGGSEELDWATWDVAEFAGKSAVIEIVDQAKGGWGHINIDHIVQSDQKKEASIVSDELYNETYRPQFHFSPRKNWTNDPNGLVYYKGEYHLFFQHNPFGIDWGNMTWGHAVSTDLVHWKQVGNALDPDKLGTMFSGSAVVDWNNTAGFQKGDEKTLVAIYTAAGGTSDLSKGQPFTQCIAYSTDAGKTWTKYEKNPVLQHIVGGNRDPKVVWYEPDKKWIMALYKDGSTFAFFSSPDLKTWTHLHDIDVPGCDECPDFFPLAVDGDKNNMKWVWTAANGRYLVGSFDGKRFAPQTKVQHSDWGRNYYAVQTFSDTPDGRRIQIAWMRGGRYPKMPFNQQMSFPCEMKLRNTPQGLRMDRTPVKELDLLRTKEQKWSDVTVKPGDNPLAGVSGELMEIQAEIEMGDASGFSFNTRGEIINYSAADKKITCLGASAPLDPAGKTIKLQILVDRSSIEVFGNAGEIAMTSCFLAKPGNKELALTGTGGTIRVVSMQVYELKSAWR